MSNVQLLYVKNTVSRVKRIRQQQLIFFMEVENLRYEKQVDVIWRCEFGKWNTLAANFQSQFGANKEYWLAAIEFPGSLSNSTVDIIEFALRFRSGGQTYWDNNQSLNYFSEPNSGVKLFNKRQLLHIDFTNKLHEGQKYLPVNVAVDKFLNAEKVTIHWTDDNWQHSHTSICHLKQKKSQNKRKSNPLDLTEYGVDLWTGGLVVANVFRLQYCISCHFPGNVLWDNNEGSNYRAERNPLTILILNLHCYQEENQDNKFSQIARAINELNVDIVCLQEVAELWNEGRGDFETNSAKIINDRLDRSFHLITDWSHLGFEKYREGVAILTRFPILKQDSKYVSDNQDVYSIHSRKVVFAQLQVPHMGLINVFSAHLSWWEDGFAEQFSRLCSWAVDEHRKNVNATMLCGDFNITAGSKGYRLVVETHEYEDQFLAVTSQDVFEKIFRVNDPYWQHYLAEDYRIDYIFLNKDSEFFATTGKVLFTEHDYGRVSDHCGYLMSFETGKH